MSCIFGWTASSGQASRQMPQAMQRLSWILTFIATLISFFPAESAAGLRSPGLKEEVENFFDGLLIFGRERVGIDLIFAFHKMHQLFGLLAAHLVPDQRIVDNAEGRGDAEAGYRFGIVMLARPCQRMRVREHGGHAEIGKPGLRVGSRVVHQFLFPFDPTATQEHIGVELAVFDFVPDLPRPHALEVDILGLFGDSDGENLRRHLFERHKWSLGGVASPRPNRFVLIAARFEIVLSGLNRLRDELVPERYTAFGLAHTEIDSRSAETGRIDPLV